jgi:glycosyltransferase involved in cell wall biosynthesis
VREVTDGESFDVVHVASLWQWPGQDAFGGARAILDAENVESVLLRGLRRIGSGEVTELAVHAVEALERKVFRQASRVLACSEQDAGRVRELAPEARVHVVPNAVDLDRYRLRAPRPAAEAPTLLFTGILTYRPNVDAVLYFIAEVFPRVRESLPGARFRIVGRYPSPEVMALAERGGVEVIPDVPDVRPYLEQADLFVVPLRAASGTRLKVLEALAAGCPVVSTPVGCEGLAVEGGVHLEIREESEGFARAVVDLARAPQRARRLAEAGRGRVEARYGWPSAIACLLDAYDEESRVAARG